MADLLVKLYELPDEGPLLQRLAIKKIRIRAAKAWEKQQVVSWVEGHFNNQWADECEVCFSRMPVSCQLATRDREIVGFACYDGCMKNFFGPVGVAEKMRLGGVGAALLISCLRAMAAAGYGYAIIGDAGSPEFYRKTVNAHTIPDSSPGIYIDKLKDPA